MDAKFPSSYSDFTGYVAQWTLVNEEAPNTMNLDTTSEEGFQAWAPEFDEGARPATYDGLNVNYDQPAFTLEVV